MEEKQIGKKVGEKMGGNLISLCLPEKYGLLPLQTCTEPVVEEIEKLSSQEFEVFPSGATSNSFQRLTVNICTFPMHMSLN